MLLTEITRQAIETLQSMQHEFKHLRRDIDPAFLNAAAIVTASIVLSSALRTVASGVRSIGGGTPQNGPTGLELVSNALRDINKTIGDYLDTE